jgi:hypothetical protein
MSRNRFAAATGMSEELRRALANRGVPGGRGEDEEEQDSDESSTREMEVDSADGPSGSEFGSEAEEVEELGDDEDSEPEDYPPPRAKYGTLVEELAKEITEGSAGRRFGKVSQLQHGRIHEALARYNVYYLAEMCLSGQLRDDKGRKVGANPFPISTCDGIGTVFVFRGYVSLSVVLLVLFPLTLYSTASYTLEARSVGLTKTRSITSS